ncbi:hypothetical protein KA005_30825, partial [bacterium]|nr:hypothetical protein [bacterium]
MVQLIPISIGMIIHRTKPIWADRLIKFVPRIGQIGLLIGVGLLLSKQASQIISIDVPAYPIMILLAIIALFVGDRMLIKEAADKRRALAISTAIRNIPLAFLIATESFPDSIIGPVTLVFSVFTMLLSIVYGKYVSRSESSN